MLALAGVPGIYFHSLFGSRNDRAGAATSSIARRINRQKLTRAQLEHDLARPDSLRVRVFARYAELLRVRRAHVAFHPHGRQQIIHVEERIFAVLRTAPDGSERVLCLHNICDSVVSLSITQHEVGRRHKNLLSREQTPNAYGSEDFTLKPYAIIEGIVMGASKDNDV